MFKLDNNFLEEVGLGSLSEDEKKPFLDHIYQELELRVGSMLSQGMTDQQLAEFEAIADGDEVKVTQWLTIYIHDYQNQDDYKTLAEKTGYDLNSVNLKVEYAASKWFEKYRPDYHDVIKSELNKLRQEIINNKDAILAP